MQSKGKPIKDRVLSAYISHSRACPNNNMALPKSEFLQTLPPTFAALPFDPRIRVGLQLSIAPSDDYHGILINSIEGTEKALNRYARHAGNGTVVDYF